MKKIILFLLCSILFTSCGLYTKTKDYLIPPDAKTLKIREQTKLKSKISVILRAGHTAYNVKKYDLALSKFEIAINKGWIDGIDLYLYADCLAKLGKNTESKIYFQKAFDELSEFYPNHSYLELLKSQGYKKSSGTE